ncbi:MAG TPA: glycerate kinase [Nocardioidaceae bacterium]|nr:glycerate kinase [Nocardioidaceae bacterium]
MPHVLVAPDKFKGSLPAREVADSLIRGIRSTDPAVDAVAVPVADGGDGTLAAALAAGYTRVPVTANGPTGGPVQTAYARRDAVAVVEMADVSGLAQLPGGRLQPLRASSRGVGEVIAAALDAGCTSIVLGIGGSACTDGGAGLAQALGARVLDAQGRQLPDGGAALVDADEVDLSGLHPRLAAAEVVVACDVDNPLTGPDGAAAVYGPQKGASPQDVAVLEQALQRWAKVLAAATGSDLSDRAGAGAAGGVGLAGLALLGGTLRPGIDLVLELVGFADRLGDARLVITGEGALDAQTLRGKAPAGVAAAAAAAGVPVVAVCGTSQLSESALRGAGITAAYALHDIEADLGRCMTEAAPLLEQLGRMIALEHLHR